MTVRVLVTGSRYWDDEETIRLALTNVRHTYGIIREDVVIVHGAARGADRIAARIAVELGMKAEAHPADWEGQGKRAGYVRNAEMVNSGVTKCLAFIKDGSRGATMCVELAEKKGIPVTRYEA